MAFDVLCYLEKRILNNKDWLLPEGIGFIEKIRRYDHGVIINR